MRTCFIYSLCYRFYLSWKLPCLTKGGSLYLSVWLGLNTVYKFHVLSNIHQSVISCNIRTIQLKWPVAIGCNCRHGHHHEHHSKVKKVRHMHMVISKHATNNSRYSSIFKSVVWNLLILTILPLYHSLWILKLGNIFGNLSNNNIQIIWRKIVDTGQWWL